MDGKIGRTFVSPKGREYSYEKGPRGIVVVSYMGLRMQVKTRDYNSTPIDDLLSTIEKETGKK